MRTLFRLLCLGALAGCTTEDSGSGCLPGPDPVLDVGKGEFAYAAMDFEGRTTPLIFGPQGGVHILVGLQARGLDGSQPWNVELSGWLNGEERAWASPTISLECNEEADALQSFGTYLIWRARPAQLLNRWVDVEARVIDAAGTRLTVRETVQIVEDSS